MSRGAFPLLLGLPPAFALLAAFCLSRDVGAVASGKPFLFYTAAFLIALGNDALRALLDRRAAAFLARLGLLLVAGQGFFSWCLFESDRIAAGFAEPGVGATRETSGPFGKPFAGKWLVTKDDSGRFLLHSGNHEALLVPGESRQFGRYQVTLRRLLPAPHIWLSDGRGTSLYDGYFKLGETEGFFRMGTLPHLFRLRYDETVPVPKDRRLPERLAARVLRGKLDLYRGTIQRGVALPVDGFTFNYDEGSVWLDIAIHKRMGRAGLGAGAMLLAAAFFAALRRGKRR